MCSQVFVSFDSVTYKARLVLQLGVYLELNMPSWWVQVLVSPPLLPSCAVPSGDSAQLKLSVPTVNVSGSTKFPRFLIL